MVQNYLLRVRRFMTMLNRKTDYGQERRLGNVINAGGGIEFWIE